MKTWISFSHVRIARVSGFANRERNKDLKLEDHRILLTGDYWHHEFQSVISNFDVPMTLVPIEKIESVSDFKFDLIVIAQSRRDQFFAVDLEKIQVMFPFLPVVGLLGSWCEGETRSGAPIPGVKRVYWHQWEGRYERFVQQLAGTGITSWHAPRTASVADQIVSDVPLRHVSGTIEYVGISAWSRAQYEMLADAITQFGWQPRWIERGVWDAETSRTISAICIEADSWCTNLESRIRWVRSEIPQAPIVLLLNYPRAFELDEIHSAGVSEVVSKPFELSDLRLSILRSTESLEPEKIES